MSSAKTQPQPLSDFVGDSALIVRLKLGHSEAQRLKSMGIFEGQSVQLCKTGNALVLSAAGGRVAIAEEVAQQILVQALEQRAA